MMSTIPPGNGAPAPAVPTRPGPRGAQFERRVIPVDQLLEEKLTNYRRTKALVAYDQDGALIALLTAHIEFELAQLVHADGS